MARGVPPSLSPFRFYVTIVTPLVLCALLVLLLIWRILTAEKAATEASEEPVPVETQPAPEEVPAPTARGVMENKAKSIGAVILERYANPEQSPEADLKDMAHALENFALLVKGDNPLPLGSNQEISTAMRGGNRMQLVFIPVDHPAIGIDGQLVDRWGTPLFFHVESRDRIDIRCAGPDKIMWTNDDLQRCHDGSFLAGKELNPASLHVERKFR